MDFATELKPAAAPRDGSNNQANPLVPGDWLVVTNRIREGNSDAFETLYVEFFDDVYRYVRILAARDEATSLDIVQEVWLKVIRSIKPFDNRPQLATWLRLVSRSVTYDWLRKEIRRNQNQQRWSENSNAADSADSADCDLDDQDVADQARLLWLEQELTRLPTETRSMIEFKYRLGWSLKRIGKVFGLRTGAVDGRIRRAIERLRNQAASFEEPIDQIHE